MSRIRKLYFFDKQNAQEMISFLNNSVMDNYINKVMFNPFLFFHHLLPLKFKFLPESFVLKDNNELKGLITIAPAKSKDKKMEIQKLFFEEDFFEEAEELVQYVVSKYKAMGAFSIMVKVDDYLPNLLSLFVNKCGFSQLSYEKLWRINKFLDNTYNKKEFRPFRNSDAKVITNLYNDSLLPHFRTLLGREVIEYKENLFRGLSYNSEYKYIIEDTKSEAVIGCVIIQTTDNENYIIEIIQTSWIDLDINSIISFAIDQIKKRKKRFGVYIKSRRYTQLSEKYETKFIENNFECVQNQIILTNSSARILRNKNQSSKYTVLTDLLPTKPLLSP